MQLAGIKISNLFSFPYISDLKLAQEVVFHNIGKNNVNVLIGPNGAGKSKFLDVITKIWKVAFMKDYMVSKQLFDSEDPEKLKSVIIENPVLLEKTYPHFNSPEKPSEVIIRFTLTEHDYDNLRFLCEHGDEINALIKKYSTINFAFSAMCIDDLVLDESTMTFHCILDIPHKSVSIDRTGLSQIKLFVLDYLIRIELIQICIDLRNMFTDSESWGSLRNTIAFIGFDRSLENISSKISPGIWERLVFEKAHKKYSAYAGYYLCAKKIWHIITSAKGTLTPAAVQNKLAQSDFFTSFTAIIQKYINKTLTVKYATGLLEFSFTDAYGHSIGFDDLSDGEQSLLVMIFTIYGYDLKGGILIIDEPEIHFHPQMQRSLSRMMEKISANIGAQFILSTYSPLFIDESNIAHVYRFSKPHDATQIRNPFLTLSSDEASLVHLLKFENMSKIFFVNKIIMVEGETDAYFFDYYLRYLHTLPQWKNKITDYEIININGKGSYKLWKKFLSRFGITSYFIGDRDNIVDYGFLTQQELSYYYKQTKTYSPKMKKTMLARGSHYNKLVLTIRDRFPQKYAELLGQIQKMYNEQVFILKRGDIETYLNLREKGLESTVAFCHHDFMRRLDDKQFEPHRKEFEEILNNIFS